MGLIKDGFDIAGVFEIAFKAALRYTVAQKGDGRVFVFIDCLIFGGQKFGDLHGFSPFRFRVGTVILTVPQQNEDCIKKVHFVKNNNAETADISMLVRRDNSKIYRRYGTYGKWGAEELVFDENYEEAQWNYCKYFTIRMKDEIEMFDNPMGLDWWDYLD